MKLSKQHGGFSNYIGKHVIKRGMWTFPKPDFIEELKKKFRHFGDTNALAFIRYTGLDVVKPDINLRRVLWRLGLIDSVKINQKTLKQIQEVGEKMAKAVCERVAVIDYTIYMFGAGEGGFVKYAVCGVVPKCNMCELTKFCKHYGEVNE